MSDYGSKMRHILQMHFSQMSIDNIQTAINTLKKLDLKKLNNDKNRKIEILSDILTELNQRDIPKGNENDDVYKNELNELKGVAKDKLNELKDMAKNKLNELKNISGGSVIKRKKKLQNKSRSKSRKRSKSRGKSKRK